MNEAIAVSVIVPVYNAEPYIERCIEALRGQTLGNMEFIFVDDCGQDRSMAIVERHAVEDGRIRIVRNERNVGPGPSRNAGIEVARGEYLGFVDQDDWVAEDFYELLYRKAKEGDFDIVKGRMARAWLDAPGGRDVRIALDGQNPWIEKELARGSALYVVFFWQHWTALYRRTLVESGGVRYGSGTPGEDDVFLFRVCHAAQRSARPFALEDRAVYYFFQRETSITHTYSRKRYNGILTSFTEIFDLLAAHAEEGAEMYRYAGDKLRWLMKLQRDELPLLPELRAYTREYRRRLWELALRLPNRFLLMRMGRQLAVPVFLLSGINLYAWEGAWKRRWRSVRSFLKPAVPPNLRGAK